MMNAIKRGTAVAFCFALACQHAWGAPITGGTGPGGIDLADGTGNVQLWLQADKGVVEGLTPGRVEAWTNQSGHAGRDATAPSTINEPALVQSAINGLPVIRFAGSGNRHFLVPNFTTGFTEGEVFTILKADDNPPAGSHGGPYRYGTSSNVHVVWSDGQIYDNFATTSRKTLPSTVGNPDRDVAAAYRNYNALGTTGLWQGRIDGNLHFNTTSNSVAFNTAPIKIGDGGLTGLLEWRGNMAEHIMFNRVLNSAERILVENYLASKYDLATINDKYQGDQPAFGNYDFDVFGVGQVDASNQVLSAGSAGFGIEVTGGLTDDTWILAGHKVALNSLVPVEGDLAPERWQRVWYVDATGELDVRFAFGHADSGLSTPFSTDIKHVLLYSETEDFNWTPFAFAHSVIDGATLFELSGFNLDGYFTVGVFVVPEPSTYVLASLGLAGLLLHARRRRKRTTGVVA